MPIVIKGAAEHNLRSVDAVIDDGLTAVTGVSGSGKSSLVFDTLYHEAGRRFLDIYTIGSSGRRLSPARVDDITGLLPAVAVAQNVLNRNPASTVATAAGIHPFLRLLYANLGERRCAGCGGPVSVVSEDEAVDAVRRAAAEGPVTLSVPLVRRVPGSHAALLSMLEDETALRVDGVRWNGTPLDPHRPHDIDVVLRTCRDTPPSGAREAIRESSWYGSSFVKIRGVSGETVIPRAPVCPECGTWFEPVSATWFNRRCRRCGGRGCEECAGSGLPPEAAAVTWAGFRFDRLLALTVDGFLDEIGGAEGRGGTARLAGEILKRAAAIRDLGMGYLTLDRPSPSLSRGEAQRLRLSVCLASRLELLHVLDEPTIGLHPTDVGKLFAALRRLSGPVVYVEHEAAAVAEADACLDIGPGAGHRGGKVVFDGSPAALWAADTPSGRRFSGRERTAMPKRRDPPVELLVIRGAREHNLAGIDVRIPLGRLTAVTGVSGSGKTTLVDRVLAASLRAGRAVGCDAISETKLSCTHVDQGPIGRNPRSNPATYTKLADTIRDLFAEVTGLPASAFSFNRKEGACPACGGLGVEEVAMRYLPSIWVTCDACGGRRFTDEVLEATVDFGGKPLSIADLYDQPIDDIAAPLLERLSSDRSRRAEGRRRSAEAILRALSDIGLGYLTLGQPSPTLSGGEAQRIKLTKYLGRRNLVGQLLVLDEPSTGLHPADVQGLLSIFDRLVRQGSTIVVVEHDRDVIRAADWVIDLGPGAGPDGGRVVYQGEVDGLTACRESKTGKGLRSRIAPGKVRRRAERGTGSIDIRGARLHNLKKVNVRIPKGSFTVVTGVSGSGKSTLVGGILEHEARRRYLETLSLYERQSVRETGGEYSARVEGLGVTVAVDPARGRYDLRSTVGTTSEIVHRLSVLFAYSRERRCEACGSAMVRNRRWECPECGARAAVLDSRRFFRTAYASACTSCHGVGTRRAFNPGKLIVRPDLPLCGGAMHSPGFFPKGYLCKPFNGGYDMVQALAARYGFDPADTPWRDISEEGRNAFLFGDPEPLEVTYRSRTGRIHTRTEEFRGFFRWIGDWDVGGTYTDTEICPACGGSGLRPEVLAVKLAGRSIHQFTSIPLSALEGIVTAYSLPAGLPESVSGAYVSVRNRIGFLVRAGLGYLHLDRHDATLSAGEAQRVKLAGLLGSGLSRLCVLLDEPSRGMHPVEVDVLVGVIRELVNEGNTAVVVEHEPAFMEAADHIVDIGPGAGTAGGRIVYQGPRAGLTGGEAPKASVTAAWLSGARVPSIPEKRREPAGWFVLKGASGNNLESIDVRFPTGVIAGVCGVSGSGKSTLVVDTLGRILAPVKQTTSVAHEPVDPEPYAGIDDPPERTVIVDQARTGVKSPGTFLDLEGYLAERYADTAAAAERGYGAGTFTRGCTACGGAGFTRMDMGFMPDVYTECEVCGGTGYPAETEEVALRGMTIRELSRSALGEILAAWGDDPKISSILGEATALGLGYLVFRQPSHALSGGEVQRLKIVRELVKRRRGAGGTLYILDEPTVGQHLEDVARLSTVLGRLADGGNTVMVVEHHPHLLASCDWLIELGPGGGPEGGRIVAQGTPETVAAGKTATAPYLRAVLEGRGTR